MCLDAVVVGKGFRHQDVVEHLDDPDAALGCFGGQEGEHFLVLLHGGVIHLRCEGIVVEFHQRSKGVAVPQKHGVHVVCGEHVKIFYPQFFVVEPWEVFRCIGIFVNLMPRQVISLLQSDAAASYFHLRSFGDVGADVDVAIQLVILCQTVGTVNGSRGVVARDGHGLSLATDGESLSRKIVVVGYADFHFPSLVECWDVFGNHGCRIVGLRHGSVFQHFYLDVVFPVVGLRACLGVQRGGKQRGDNEIRYFHKVTVVSWPALMTVFWLLMIIIPSPPSLFTVTVSLVIFTCMLPNGVGTLPSIHSKSPRCGRTS